MKERVITYILLLTVNMYALSQTVDFTADTLEGCETLTVKFTDLSSGIITSKQWDFGDGVTTEAQNPTHTYDSGIYSVRLTINNNESELKTNYIKVYAKPNPAFYFADTLKLGGRNITFHGFEQEYEDYATYNRAWEFGDGLTGTGRITLHQYADTGAYNVKQTVTINNFSGCASDTTIKVVVRDKIYLPNVFTPNGDGENELFIIEYNGVSFLNIQVFTKYGLPVYKNSSPIISWNGRTNSGEKLHTGVYYYTLTSDDGEINETGFVHLFSSK